MNLLRAMCCLCHRYVVYDDKGMCFLSRVGVILPGISVMLSGMNVISWRG